MPVSSILVSSSNGTQITTLGGTLQMQASVLPNNATNRSITWNVYEADGVTPTDKAIISSTGSLQKMI